MPSPQSIESRVNSREREDNIQTWEQRLRQKSYVSPASYFASDNYHARSFAVTERLLAASSEPSSLFSTMQLQAAAKRLNSETPADLYQLVKYLQQERFYSALQHYLRSLQPPPSEHKPFLGQAVDTLGHLHRQWNTEFYGSALDALKEKIYREESLVNQDFYAKTIPIIQSSGTGKSRLVDELGKEFLSISFVFRLNGESGYPPGDPEITKFIMQNLTLNGTHSVIVSLLAGALFEVNLWLQGNSRPGGNIAKKWHDSMTPLHVRQGLSESGQMSDIIASTRSDDRKGFCAKTAIHAQQVLELLGSDKNWTSLFDQETPEYDAMKCHPLVVKYLLDPAVKLLGHLQEKKPVLFVFDEVAHLFENKHGDILYSALRRVLRLLKDHPIWALFLSTQSHVQYFVHADSADSSSRIRNRDLVRVEPFYGLEVDTEMGRRFNNKALREAEMGKPLSQFAKADHMTLYGRPLWLIYRNSPPLLRHMALCKLFNTGEVSVYDPNSTHHVFAALASRVSLDPCPNTLECVSLAREAVNSHLRLILQIDQVSGSMTTTALSEPIVAEAVASLLQRTRYGALNWTESINTLSWKLLHPGLVEKGIKGELYARLVFVLARDLLQGKANLVCDFPYAMPFTVVNFLRSLFNRQHHTTLEEAVAQAERSTAREGIPAQTKLGTAFKNAYLNFTHFTYTDQNLKPSNMVSLLHGLMHAQAALQLSFCQPVWDLLIPIYFGNPTDPFEPSCLSAMLVQVKNRTKMEKFSLSPSDYKSHFPKNFSQPVLSILLELGTKEIPQVQSVNSFSPNIYGFRVTGSGSAIFGCLAQDEGRLETACSTLLHVLSSDGCNIQDQICDRNVRFRYHTFEERFPKKSEAVETKGGGGKTEHVIGASGAGGLNMDIDG